MKARDLGDETLGAECDDEEIPADLARAAPRPRGVRS